MKRHKSGNGGFQSECKDCRSDRERTRRTTPEFKDAQVEYRTTPAAKARQKRAHSSEKGRANRKKNNKTAIGRARQKRQQDRRKAKPGVRAELSLQEKIRRMITIPGYKSSILETIGCTRSEFVEHLELRMKQFPGMTWKNYGYGKRGHEKRRGWDVDHIVPKSKYDHTNIEDVKRCWNLKNLNPFWHTDNLDKSDKLIHSAIQTVPVCLWPLSWNGQIPT